MTPIDRQIVYALKSLIRRNDGEIHGFWTEIADKLACEIGGMPDDYIVQKYEQHLRELGLKYFFEDHPDIVFIRGAAGDLNFIDRSLCYVTTEATVTRKPGCAPMIVWRDLT